MAKIIVYISIDRNLGFNETKYDNKMNSPKWWQWNNMHFECRKSTRRGIITSIRLCVCVCWQLYMELGSVSDRLLAALQGELRPVCLSLLGSSRFRGRPRETGVLCTGRYIGMEKEDVVDVDYS